MRDLNPEELETLRNGDQGWANKTAPKRGPYLLYVNGLSTKWPHLKFLSDFMEVGTHPLRWDAALAKEPGAYSTDPNKKDEQKTERYKRVKVTILQYGRDAERPTSEKECTSTKALTDALDSLNTDGLPKTNLIVVEDLSRDVIELLGSRFDVDPSFFREHLADYAWYNIGSWWRDPPNLDVSSSKESWFTLRFLRTRCFKNKESFEKGRDESREFNVLRRLDNDRNENPNWHGDIGQEVKIGHIRSRASLWVEPSPRPGGPYNAILLLDPTIKEGDPLWFTYRNWETPPSMKAWSSLSSNLSDCPNRPTFFDDFLYWARNPSVLSLKPCSAESSTTTTKQSPLDTAVCALLHLVCAEWLTATDYTNTRLNQIDWELTLKFPFDANSIRAQLNHANTRMHHWRRAIPLYRKMLSDTLVTVFREAPYVPGLSGGLSGQRLPIGAPVLAPVLTTDAVRAYRADVLLRLAAMQDLQDRFDKLSEKADAAAATEESRNSNTLNQRLSNLTWLATTFLPLSLIAGVLSVQEDLNALRGSIGYWAEISIPVTAGTMLVLFLVEHAPLWYKNMGMGKKSTNSNNSNKQEQEGLIRRRSSLFSSTPSLRPGVKDRTETDMSLRMHRLTAGLPS